MTFKETFRSYLLRNLEANTKDDMLYISKVINIIALTTRSAITNK